MKSKFLKWTRNILFAIWLCSWVLLVILGFDHFLSKVAFVISIGSLIGLIPIMVKLYLIGLKDVILDSEGAHIRRWMH